MQIPIEEIRIKEGRRSLDSGYVKELAASIREMGLLNPITVDRENVLIAGLHRMEAAKILGWTKIPCTVSSLEGLAAELAEIDENIVRSDISALEYGEILLRRKEIYETLHPETKNGGDRRSGKTRSAKCTSDPARSFVEDTAEKLGVNPCTVRRQIQTAKNLSPETKEIIRGADAKLSKKSALKLSRLGPEQQKEAATLLASREIRSVDEYAAKEKEAAEEISAQETSCGQQEPPEKGTLEDGGMNGGQRVSAASADMQKEAAASLKEIVAELKDPDKDCSGTPESFLAEYSAFVGKFHREIGWYSDPYYDTVYPALTEAQLARLRELTDSICSVAEEMYHRAEQMYRRTEHKRKG